MSWTVRFSDVSRKILQIDLIQWRKSNSFLTKFMPLLRSAEPETQLRRQSAWRRYRDRTGKLLGRRRRLQELFDDKTFLRRGLGAVGLCVVFPFRYPWSCNDWPPVCEWDACNGSV